ncbi:hypothetical protein AMJ80_03115 [bacterium SM23_31]|nr:MAG: hypothetical protein AMJ80_03115 [bacterium SM23_31]
MDLPIYKLDGTQSGDTVILNEQVFGTEPKDHLVYRVIVSHLAAQRQGTHMVRNRALVSGSGRKLYRQKGTGRSRAGTAKTNIRRGGGRAFGPKPHKYTVGINKKEKKIARRAALSDKVRNNAVLLIDDFIMDKPSTRFVMDVLNALNFTNNDKALLVIKEHSPYILKSCRNIKNLLLRPACQICTFDVVRQERLIIQKSAVEYMNEAF